MLAEIRIESLGAISSAVAEFDRGLTVLTGETGAGKTMVVTGLHLLGGARADATRVRSGAARAVVEGRFNTDDLDPQTAAQIDEILESSGADRDDDGSVIALRTVNRDGPSRAYLGGRSVPAKTLTTFTTGLLTNDEVLAIDQDPLAKAALCVTPTGDARVFVKELADGTKAVGLFNMGGKPLTINLDWKATGLKNPQQLRDLWRQKDLGTFNGSYSSEVPSHGVLLLKVSPGA